MSEKNTGATGEITVRYDYPPIQLDKMKNIDYAKWWGCGETGNPYAAS